MLLLLTADSFQNYLFHKKNSRTNDLDPDSNCLQRLSADDMLLLSSADSYQN